MATLTSLVLVAGGALLPQEPAPRVSFALESSTGDVVRLADQRARALLIVYQGIP